MGAGCLILVNDIPENREAVGDAGLFYPFNNQFRLTELMVQVCQKPHEYSLLRKAALERVRRFFDWDQVTEEYEKLFYRLLTPSSRSACPRS